MSEQSLSSQEYHQETEEAQESRKQKTCKKQTKSRRTTQAQDNSINLYFLAWENEGIHFLNGIKIANPPQNLQVHVFYAKGTATKKLPKPASWLIGHESLTTSKEAIWVDLTAYVISLYARNALGPKCSQCAKGNARPKLNMALICGEEEKGKELTAVLKANSMEIKIIDSKKQTFLDMFEHVCHCCKLIFEKKSEAEEHDKAHHNFLCHNTQCERSRRGNGFYTQEELEIHLRAQKFCKFCPSDVFCMDLKYDEHVHSNHKPCPCPCKEYYECDEDLFEHYYARYPLPCLEEPKCLSRFKNIEAQAFHHKSMHGSEYPYFCMACFKIEKLVCLKTGEELMAHTEEEGHREKDFKFAIIPTINIKSHHRESIPKKVAHKKGKQRYKHP